MAKVIGKKDGGNLAKAKEHLRGIRMGRGDKFESPLSVSKIALLDKSGRSDRQFRQLLYDFSVLAKYLESARAYLSSHIGLSPPQYNILMLIAQYQGDSGVGVTEVAQRLHASTAFITGEVRKLGELGLVTKQPNPNDGRGVLLRLSLSGEVSVRAVAPERLFVNDQLFRNLTGGDFQHLSRIVVSLIDDFAHTIEMLDGRRRDQMRRAARLAGAKR